MSQDRAITTTEITDHVAIRRYIEHMQQKDNPRFAQAGLSDASIARRLAALNGYFEYVRATDDQKLRNPLRELSNRWRKNDQPKPIDDATLDSLLEGITNERDRVLFSLFLATGLRVSEMHQLNRDSIKIEDHQECGWGGANPRRRRGHWKGREAPHVLR